MPAVPAPASRTHQPATCYRKLSTLKRAHTAFDAIPAEERGARRPLWVEPKLVAEVDFHGWTHGDRVRHASFQGLREDKAAKEVVHEVKAKAIEAAAMPAVNKTAASETAECAGRREGGKEKCAGENRRSHPHPSEIASIGKMPASPNRISPNITAASGNGCAPHVAGRPISLLRCPEGAAGQCFFQKHAAAGIATDHLHLIPEKDDKIISIDDLDGLLSLVQAGVLEVHTRGTDRRRSR